MRARFVALISVAAAACTPSKSPGPAPLPPPAALVCSGPAPTPTSLQHAQQLIQTRSVGAIAALNVSDDNLLATIDVTGDVRVWDIAHRALVGSSRHPALHDAAGLVWAPDGRTFAVLTRRKDEYTRITWLDARAHTTEPPSCAPENMVPLGNAASLRWIAHTRKGVELLDPKTCKRIPVPLPGDVDQWKPITISRDGTTLAVEVGSGWGVRTWGVGVPANQSLVAWPIDAPEHSRRVPIKPHRGDGTFRLGPHGTFAVVARGVGQGVSDERNPHRLTAIPLDGSGDAHSFAELPHYTGSLDISPDGSLVAGTSTDFAEGMFEVASIPQRRVLWKRQTDDLDGNVPNGAIFTARGGWVIVPTDGPIYVFDAETGRIYARLGAMMPAKPTQVAFLPSDVLATTSHDRVTLWSLRDGRVIERERVTAAIAVGATPGGDVAVARSPVHWTDPTFGHPGRRDTRWHKSQEAQLRWEQECPYEHHYDPNRPDDEIWPIFLEAWKGLEPRERGFDRLEAQTAAKLPTPTWPPSALGRVCVHGYDVELVDLHSGIAIIRDGMQHHIHDLTTDKDIALKDEPGYANFRISVDGSRVVSYDKAWINQSYLALADIWDAHTGALLESWPATAAGIGKPWDVGTYALAPDGHTIAAVVIGSTGRALVIRDLETQRTLHEIPLDVPPTAIAFGASTHDLYLGTPEGDLIVMHDAVEVARGTSDGGSIDSITFDASTGKRIATVSGDGALRIWDPARAIHRVTLVAFDDDESLAFTPHGAYVGTQEASDRVVWVFDNPVEPFRFSQFAESYERPDAVARRLAGDDVDVTATNERPPYAPEIVETRVSGAIAHVRARVHGDARTRTLAAFANGRPVVSKLVCSAEADVSFDVPLATDENSIAVAADDDRGRTSNPSTARVQGPPTAGRPDLWIISIGVDHYPNLPERFQLGFAAADARGLAETFATQVGPNRPYANVHRQVLTDSAVSIDSVRTALSALQDMRAEDVAIVFFGGHGVKPDDKGEMVFVTGAVKSRIDGSVDAASLVDAGIGWTQIGDLLARARGRVVVLLDACHSGNVATDVVQNGDLAESLMRDRRAGTIVFAAAKGRQFSYEPNGARGFKIATDAQRLVMHGQQSQHGYFTGAVLESLASSDTDADRDGVIELSEVLDDVARRVTAATDGHQTPWVARREIFGDFGLAAPPAITTQQSPTPNWDEEYDWGAAEDRRVKAIEAATKAEAEKKKKYGNKKPACDPGDPLCGL